LTSFVSPPPPALQESEPSFVRRMKIEILTALVASDNIGQILREFGGYVKDDDKDFVKACIHAIVRMANALPEVADRCLRGLMALVGTDSDVVVAEAVIAIRQLLQQHPQHDSIIVRLARRLATTTSPSARAAIVWILGEFQDKARVASMAPDALRLLAKGFRSEAAEVKVQVLNLAAKTALQQPASAAVQLLLKYVLELARYDVDYDLRDRARTLRHLMLSTSEIAGIAADATEEAGAVIAVGAGTAAGVKGFRAESDGAEEAAAAALAAVKLGESAETDAAALAAAADGSAAAADGAAAAVADAAAGTGAAAAAAPAAPAAAPLSPGKAAAPAAVSMRDRVRAVLLAAKPPPAVESALSAPGAAPAFMMGSLSFMVGHAARGYEALPAWAAEDSAAALREPPRDEDDEPVRKKRSAFSPEEAEESSDEDEESSEEEEDDEDDEDDGAFVSLRSLAHSADGTF